MTLAPALLDVVVGASRGETVAQTAARRVVSPATVRTQRRHALRELGARTLPQAVAIVARNGGLNRE